MFENAPGDLFVNGTPFDDTLTVPEGAFQTGFNGGEGNDSIIGSEKVEFFNSEPGNETFVGGGNDGTHPQGFLDTVNYQGARSDYVINRVSDDTFTVTDLNLSNGDDGTDTLINLQAIGFSDDFIDLQPRVTDNGGGDYFIGGTPFDDTITGVTGAIRNSIDGREGNDSLVGGAESDGLRGGAGNDTLIGGGNAGNHPQGFLDDAQYSGVRAGYSVTANGDGTFTVVDTDLSDGDEGTDLLIDIEAINFTDEFVRLQPSVFENAPGDFFVNGTEFDDTLSAPAGAFQTGFDGGEGNDSMIGGLGVDFFQGEPGNDTFDGVGNDGTHPQGFLDTVNYQEVIADYDITQVNANTYTVTDLNPTNGDDGTDTLVSLQGIGFTDDFLLL